jgi:transposase
MGRACGPSPSICSSSSSSPNGRVRELLADLFGASLSLGTLLRWVEQSAATLAPVEARLKEALVHAPVLHVDETGVRRGG